MKKWPKWPIATAMIATVFSQSVLSTGGVLVELGTSCIGNYSELFPVQQKWMVHPGPSASMAGDKLSVRTTAEELNRRRKATVYIDPIFAPCCLNIQPGVRTSLLEFPFDSTRNIVRLLYGGTLSRGPEVGAVEQIRFGHDAEHPH